MFNLDNFRKGAHNGEAIDLEGFVKYVRSHESVILWGAGNLGTAIGRKFIETGIPVTCYWDIRAKDIVTRNDIAVIEPFSGGFDKEKSLVIFCIANVPVGPNLYNMLSEQSWPNVIKGSDILQGLLCPLSNDRPLNTKICNDLDMCTVCSCERLSNIVKNKVFPIAGVPYDDLLSFDRVHFIVNNFCNLKCTHCFLYMNSYPNERKKNVPIDRILADIDAVLNAVHSFGVVNIFGGETFLHPDISRIVARVLEHSNFGSAVVSTNGVRRIRPEQLESLRDGRVRLAFSNYIGSLTPAQEDTFIKNIEFTRSLGVNAKSQNHLPNWNISSPLVNKHFSVDCMTAKKENCGVRFLYVFDGKVFPCAFALSIYDLGVADYPTDYVDITRTTSPEDLRNKIREMLDRRYYGCCGHCDPPEECLTDSAGAQGFDERYAVNF